MIEAWTESKNYGKKGSIVSILVRYNNYEIRRTIRCGHITSNQAELKALELIMQSIKEKYRSDIIIKTNGLYTIIITERNENEWKRNPINNVPLVNKIRELLKTFKTFKIIQQKDETTERLQGNINKLLQNNKTIEIYERYPT